jgi:hypothetical protein
MQSSSSDEEADAGAPAAEVYENQSGGILDALAGLLSKAEEQLDAARKEETSSKHNFELLEQGLEDEIKFANADMDKSKKSLAENTEKKAGAEGDLEKTSADLAADTQSLADLHHDCMTRASDYEDETKSRGEELKALATAIRSLKRRRPARMVRNSRPMVLCSLSFKLLRAQACRQTGPSVSCNAWPWHKTPRC